FFSSRRRHTRSDRDWSSDVCSSDLIGKGDWHHFVAPAGTKLNLGLTPGQLVSAFGVALIAVFWAYDGWVYITWASGEVKDARRKIGRASCRERVESSGVAVSGEEKL